MCLFFFFSSRRRHTRFDCDWSSDVCSSDLDAAERELQLSLSVAPVPGAWVERKRFAVALHYRQVDQALVPEVEQRVVEVAERHSDLRQTGGKRVFELRSAIDWDKGKALIYSLE